MPWLIPIGIFLLFTILYLYRNEIEVRTIVSKNTTKKAPRIGIVSDWHRKGVPYQSRFLSKCLSDKHEVYIFAYHDYIRDESDYGYKSLVFTKNIKPWKVINWIKKNNLKVIFFPDRLEDPKVLDWCKANKVATVMIINYETISKNEFDLYRKYKVLMCPVKCTQILLKKQGFRNTRFIRWAVDDKIFQPKLSEIKMPIKFIHNAGYGGVEWRKNTYAVVKAFDMATKKNKNIKLILKSQRSLKEYPEEVKKIAEQTGFIHVIDKDLKLADLLELYRSCHVSLLPSKWEGIGIPFIESLALGLPVITVDAPPMNEWVRHNYNGLCAKVMSWEQRKDKQLLIKGAIVDTEDLAKLIDKLSSPDLIARLRLNAIRSTKNSKKTFTREIEKLIRCLNA